VVDILNKGEIPVLEISLLYIIYSREYDIIYCIEEFKKVIYMKDIEQIIKEVSGTMAMEGMHLKEEDKERIRICLSDEVSFEEMKKRIIEKHTVRI